MPQRISFLNYWNKKSKEPEGKLDTYFEIKKCFSWETYLSINNFRLRRALCQIRTHELKIERDRYKKPYVERSQRICEKYSSNQTEDELRFIINVHYTLTIEKSCSIIQVSFVQNLKIYPMKQNLYGFLQMKTSLIST